MSVLYIPNSIQKVWFTPRNRVNQGSLLGSEPNAGEPSEPSCGILLHSQCFKPKKQDETKRTNSPSNYWFSSHTHLVKVCVNQVEPKQRVQP